MNAYAQERDVFDGSPISGGDKCRPRFFYLPVQFRAESEASGHPVFKDVEMVEIFIPGDAKSQPCHKVRDHHIKRWPAQYASFKNGLAQRLNGTPLEQWPGLTVGQIATFNACEIRTVEDLANLSDGQMDGIGMGAREIRARAAAWLEQAQGGAAAERLAAENARKDDQIAELRRQMDELKTAVAASAISEPRGTGRASKSHE